MPRTQHHLQKISHHFLLWAAIIISVSTLMVGTQQVLGIIWHEGQKQEKADWLTAISNFSCSSFISTWLLRYKFIPKPTLKEREEIQHKHIQNHIHGSWFNSSSSSVIMWGSKPLLTESTTDISVFTLQRLYTLSTIVSPNLPEVTSLLNTSEVSGKRFTTSPLQRFPNVW
jgi:hypothetical protein